MKPYEKYPTLMVILIPVACAIGFTIPPYMSNGLALITNYATISPNFLGNRLLSIMASGFLYPLVMP